MTLFRKIVFIISAIAILILGMWFSVILHQFICTPLYSEKEIKQAMTIQVSPGTGVHYLANHLYQRGLLQHPQFFIWLARLTRDASLLKAGEYQITQSTTPRDLLDNIAAGKVKQRSITFIEGWTFRQVKAALNENLHIKHTITTLTDQQIMTQLGHPDRRPEGLFFPDTYFFTWGDSDIKVLRESYQRMQTVLNVAWQRRAKNLAYKNPYQALIVASLVEKETALSKERSEIAGVILRRLKKRMLLQVDPTVLYGLGRPYYSRIKKEDLIKNTTYNTYQHCGLPPTPIDMPSYGSITAALNPAGGSTLYYVAQGDDGSHVFSATYKEHCQAVKKYRQEEALFEWYNAVFKIDWRDGWKLNGVVLFHLRELKGLEKQQHLTMCARNLMRKVFLMLSHENRGGHRLRKQFVTFYWIIIRK